MKLADGKRLVKAARAAVALHFEGRDFVLENFSEKRGVFVSIHTFSGKGLRGCIGFSEPLFSLSEGLVKAALQAAFHDPRFLPLRKDELENVVFEVSVLTVPKEVEDIKKIKIGRDGLIAEYDSCKGLLLPQVFAHYKCTVEQALSMTCEKAGLPGDFWKTGKVKFCSFQADIFSEKSPDGDVEKQ